MEQNALPEIVSEQGLLLAMVLKDQSEVRPVYRPGFYIWLRDNYVIWQRFAYECEKVRSTGRQHYSARTVIEYIRHETALREAGEVKLNNNAAPSMARLYMAAYSCPDFFQLRGD